MEALLEAIFHNDLQQVREIIEAGVDVNQPLEDGDLAILERLQRLNIQHKLTFSFPLYKSHPHSIKCHRIPLYQQP